MSKPYGSEFTVTLPSDASRDIYPANKISHYTTQLREPIEIGHGKWEVDQVDIHYPTSWLNVMENEMTVTLIVNSKKPWTDFSMPKGNYPDSQIFLKTLDNILKEKSDGFIYLKGNVNSDIQGEYEDPVTIEVNSNPKKATQISAITLSKPLANVLGLFDSVTMMDKFKSCTVRNASEKNRVVTDVNHPLSKDHSIIVRRLVQFSRDVGGGTDIRRTIFSLPRPVDVNRGFKLFYVYGDIVENRHVGDVMSNLLRVFPPEFKKKGRENEIVHHEFIHSDNLPIKKGLSYLQHITILITDELGRPIEFTYGKLLVTLTFRKTLNFVE